MSALKAKCQTKRTTRPSEEFLPKIQKLGEVAFQAGLGEALECCTKHAPSMSLDDLTNAYLQGVERQLAVYRGEVLHERP